MNSLVSDLQSSFILERKLTHNIVVVHEIIHSMKRKSGKKGWMAIKMDLEKAYDQLRWSFVKDTLTMAHIPTWLIDRIMHCISNFQMKVLWNDFMLEAFTPTRGVRQGDSLSPYIFVLVMEVLAHRIQHAIDSKRWEGIRLGRSGPIISHLFFADDMFLFAEATIEQARVIKEVLHIFSDCSGQRVNRQKTKVYFSKNVSLHDKNSISREFGFGVTSNLGKYIGSP
ncbi:hypothetical protein Scep_004286 [Stephania cephalantha]|uniref:Reverse transcriptase domain-containing protein n=1 Tax=Stephania cephalantha TaxID=152367 RepID=A0AAP0KU04_9MAGN